MEPCIEPHILPLVESLNGSQRFRTIASCEGHSRRHEPPYVLLRATLENARRLEAVLRAGWFSGTLHYEWSASGRFDGFSRPVWNIRLFLFETDLTLPPWESRLVREDLRSMARLVDELQARSERSMAELVEQIGRCGNDDGEAERNSHYPDATLRALFTNGPRTWMPATRTGLELIRKFLAAFGADLKGHGGLPYPLLVKIRGEDVRKLASWCQKVEPRDPLELLAMEAGLRSIGCEGAGGWPPIRSAGGWFVFWGELDDMAKLVAAVRRMEWLEPPRLGTHWEAEIRFDLVVHPILVLWNVGKALRADKTREDMARIAAALREPSHL